ncbi:insulinase family protein, partial [archaeon]
MPIGLTSVVRAITPVSLKRFYRKWYRPELVTIFVVGNFVSLFSPALPCSASAADPSALPALPAVDVDDDAPPAVNEGAYAKVAQLIEQVFGPIPRGGFHDVGDDCVAELRASLPSSASHEEASQSTHARSTCGDVAAQVPEVSANSYVRSGSSPSAVPNNAGEEESQFCSHKTGRGRVTITDVPGSGTSDADDTKYHVPWVYDWPVAPTLPPFPNPPPPRFRHNLSSPPPRPYLCVQHPLLTRFTLSLSFKRSLVEYQLANEAQLCAAIMDCVLMSVFDSRISAIRNSFASPPFAAISWDDSPSPGEGCGYRGVQVAVDNMVDESDDGAV